MDVYRFDEDVNETIAFNLIAETGAVIAAADVLTAQLTLYDQAWYDTTASPVTGIINGRDGQNVLNVNNVTIADPSSDEDDRLVTWSVQPEDNAPPDDEASRQGAKSRQVWRHIAEFVFTVTGPLTVRYTCEIDVTNLRKAGS